MDDHTIPETSAIYVITCLPNGKIYVGQTINAQRRWREHSQRLNGNRHGNKHLQDTWRHYGAAAFTFKVLEFTERQCLTEREQYWLDRLRPFGDRGFNVNPIAELPPSTKGKKLSAEARYNMGMAQKGRKKSPEHIEKIRIAITGKVLGQRSPENRARISAGLTGIRKSPEHVEKMAATKRKAYILIAPDNYELSIVGLRRFCRDHDLDESALIRVAQGKQRTHKGWKCRYL